LNISSGGLLVTGNVGIGTTSPTRRLDIIASDNSGIRLKQNAQIPWALAANNFYNGMIFENTATAHAWSMGYGQGAIFSINWHDPNANTFTNYFTISSGGNVGIGTTSPSGLLHVRHNANRYFVYTSIGNIEVYGPESGNDGNYVRLGASYNQLGLYASNTMYFNTSSTGGYVFGQDSSEKVRITGDGNVGIGTTSPSEKLHVIGKILASDNITAYSDARIKKNILTIENALEKVKKLRGVSYTRIDNEETNIGVIAQEVREVIPEVVSGSEETQYSIAYGNMVGLLIEAIKELKAQVDAQNEIIANLENKYKN